MFFLLAWWPRLQACSTCTRSRAPAQKRDYLTAFMWSYFAKALSGIISLNNALFLPWRYLYNLIDAFRVSLLDLPAVLESQFSTTPEVLHGTNCQHVRALLRSICWMSCENQANLIRVDAAIDFYNLEPISHSHFLDRLEKTATFRIFHQVFLMNQKLVCVHFEGNCTWTPHIKVSFSLSLFHFHVIFETASNQSHHGTWHFMAYLINLCLVWPMHKVCHSR